MAGSRFHDYELVRELGRGATACVYQARHLQSEEAFCLKIFHPRLFGDARFMQRIEREMEVSAQLQHPNIVRVHRVLKDSDPPAIAMDFIDGENLEQFQRRLPYVLPEVSVLIVIRILQALEYAHGKGVIHRDLKPENVLISRGGQVIVTDFGLAKLRDSAATTQSNVILGTLDYLSPEQARGDTVSPPSDLFSVGSILYFLTTGTRPFSRSTPLAILAAIQNDNPEPAQRRNPKLSGPLCRILQKAIAKDAAARFACAGAFREALIDYLLELGLDEKSFNLEVWSRDPSVVTLEALKAAAESLTLVCETALGERRQDRFLETLAHLSLKAPESPSLARLTARYRSARRTRSRGVLFASGALVTVLIAAGIGYRERHRESAQGGSRIVAARSAPVVAPPPPTSRRSKVAAKKGLAKASPTTARHRKGTVVFDLDPDVVVFWNGRKVDPTRPLAEQPVGDNTVLLDRPGYDPIRARIRVKANETTVIRVKSRDETESAENQQ